MVTPHHTHATTHPHTHTNAQPHPRGQGYTMRMLLFAPAVLVTVPAQELYNCPHGECMVGGWMDGWVGV